MKSIEIEVYFKNYIFNINNPKEIYLNEQRKDRKK